MISPIRDALSEPLPLSVRIIDALRRRVESAFGKSRVGPAGNTQRVSTGSNSISMRSGQDHAFQPVPRIDIDVISSSRFSSGSDQIDLVCTRLSGHGQGDDARHEHGVEPVCHSTSAVAVHQRGGTALQERGAQPADRPRRESEEQRGFLKREPSGDEPGSTTSRFASSTTAPPAPGRGQSLRAVWWSESQSNETSRSLA